MSQQKAAIQYTQDLKIAFQRYRENTKGKKRNDRFDARTPGSRKLFYYAKKVPVLLPVIQQCGTDKSDCQEGAAQDSRRRHTGGSITDVDGLHGTSNSYSTVGLA